MEQIANKITREKWKFNFTIPLLNDFIKSFELLVNENEIKV